MDTNENMVLVNDCMQRQDRLSNWEQDFLQSIAEQIAKGRALSEKQVNKLNSIWDKATEGG